MLNKHVKIIICRVLLTRKLNFRTTRNKSVWTPENIVKSPFKDVNVPQMTIDNYVWRNLDKWPTKTAIVCADSKRCYKYEEVYKKAQILGANLRKKLNISDQDCVAVILPNIPEFPIIAFGIMAAGGVVAPLNPMFTADELKYQMNISKPKVIIALPDNVHKVKVALNNCQKSVPILCVDLIKQCPEGTISYKEVVDDNHIDLDILSKVEKNPMNAAILFHSSGTTGLSKTVQLTHRNIVANCEQISTECRVYNHTNDITQDSTLVLIPMYHIYSFSGLMIHKMSEGLRLVTLPKFHPEMFAESLVDYKINLLCLTPPTILFMGSHSLITKKHLDHLRVIISGAAPLPQIDIIKVLEKAKQNTHFTNCFGMTEVGYTTFTPIGVNNNYNSIGFPIPNIELRVIDENCNNLGPNEVGELLIKGPNVMKGYMNSEITKNDVYVDNEWLRTGDLMKIDENGTLHLTDRIKELIKVKGYQVAPAELESVLRDHPAILDAAVIGIPDSRTGEAPIAFVILKNGLNIDRSDIIEFAASRLAPYKKIKYIKIVDEIPKTNSGKILKRLLKERF